MTSIGIELPKQIERVSALRERYRAAARDCGGLGNFGPAIAMMTDALDRACSAIAEQDAIACCRAYEDLKGFGDD